MATLIFTGALIYICQPFLHYFFHNKIYIINKNDNILRVSMVYVKLGVFHYPRLFSNNS